MNAPVSPPVDPQPDVDPGVTEAFVRPLIERQLERLDRLAEAGLNIALACERQATGRGDEGAAPVASDNVVMAYARVARSVRLTSALQSRLIESLRALDQARAEAEAQAVEQRFHQAEARKARVERIVLRQVKAEHEGEAAEAVEQAVDEVLFDVEQWLDHGLYGDVLARPLIDIVAEVCRDVRLKVDPADLARQMWARDPENGVPARPGLRARMAAQLGQEPPLGRSRWGFEEPEPEPAPPPDDRAKAALARAETRQLQQVLRNLRWAESHLEPDPDG